MARSSAGATVAQMAALSPHDDVVSDDTRWTRRDFLSTTAIGLAGLVARGDLMSSADERLAYVGTYTTDGRSQGIYRLRLDVASGALRLDGTAAKATNPSYLALHPNGRVLYAVNEISEFKGEPTGTVSAFSIAPASGALTLINQQASQGKAPCYVSVDRTGGVVLVANYGGGSIATLPVRRGGGLEIARNVVKHDGAGADPVRQAAPHAHCIVADPDNRFVLAVDLGIDAVLSYRFDPRTAAITVVPSGAATKPGAGPRHLVFHPNGRFAYVVNELDSTLAAYTYDAEQGGLAELQVAAASPGGPVTDNHPADVHVAASGRFLYVSNRGDDTIAVFAIDGATGQLAPVQQVPSGGKSPRNFSLDPTGRFLVAANQKSDNIVSFRVDADSGRLTPTGSAVELASPVCVRFR
jgi:6-phosphogluconolactonase